MKCKYFFLFLVLTTFPMILNCSGSENRSTVTNMAGAAGSNSLQAVAEPNPAKVNSVIRATFIGGDKENAYGTVKIYDSTGHEVKDGGYGDNVPSTVVNCVDGDIEVLREGKGSVDLLY